MKYDLYAELCTKLGKENVWLSHEECLQLQKSAQLRPGGCVEMPMGASAKDVGVSVSGYDDLFGDLIKKVNDEMVVLYNKEGFISLVTPSGTITFSRQDQKEMVSMKFIDDEGSYFQCRSNKDGKATLKYYDGESVSYLNENDPKTIQEINSTDFDKFGIVPDEEVAFELREPYKVFMQFIENAKGISRQLIENNNQQGLSR